MMLHVFTRLDNINILNGIFATSLANSTHKLQSAGHSLMCEKLKRVGVVVIVTIIKDAAARYTSEHTARANSHKHAPTAARGNCDGSVYVNNVTSSARVISVSRWQWWCRSVIYNSCAYNWRSLTDYSRN